MQLAMFEFDQVEMGQLDLSRCVVRPVNFETAKNMVVEYHYAHRVPSIVVSLGMYVDDVLAGVLTYGIPANRNVLRCCGDEFISRGLELNRLFIHDWAGRNSESWLIGQSFKWLRTNTNYCILVSYADPLAGHLGCIYQATNWLYTGLSSVSRTDMIVDGVRMHGKSVGDMYGSRSRRKLVEMGHTVEILEELPKYRYVYFLGSKRERKVLRSLLKWPVLPYPKEKKS